MHFSANNCAKFLNLSRTPIRDSCCTPSREKKHDYLKMRKIDVIECVDVFFNKV